MKPLIVLLITFFISLLAIKLFRGNYDVALSGTIAMSVMLLFTSIAHFAFTKGMSMMLPESMPYKITLVHITGIFEIAAAIALFIPGLAVTTAWLLIIFFACMLPANIYAAIKHVDYQKADYNGNGPVYLWFRVPLQILFVAWVYLAVLYH